MNYYFIIRDGEDEFSINSYSKKYFVSAAWLENHEKMGPLFYFAVGLKVII